jgi:hypothetical protein
MIHPSLVCQTPNLYPRVRTRSIDTAEALDLDADETAALLLTLDPLALRLERVTDRLAGGVDPGELAGSTFSH